VIGSERKRFLVITNRRCLHCTFIVILLNVVTGKPLTFTGDIRNVNKHLRNRNISGSISPTRTIIWWLLIEGIEHLESGECDCIDKTYS